MPLPYAQCSYIPTLFLLSHDLTQIHPKSLFAKKKHVEKHIIIIITLYTIYIYYLKIIKGVIHTLVGIHCSKYDL